MDEGWDGGGLAGDSFRFEKNNSTCRLHSWEKNDFAIVISIISYDASREHSIQKCFLLFSLIIYVSPTTLYVVITQFVLFNTLFFKVVRMP